MIEDQTAEAMHGCLLLITALMSAEHHTKVQGVAVLAVIGNTGTLDMTLRTVSQVLLLLAMTQPSS